MIVPVANNFRPTLELIDQDPEFDSLQDTVKAITEELLNNGIDVEKLQKASNSPKKLPIITKHFLKSIEPNLDQNDDACYFAFATEVINNCIIQKLVGLTFQFTTKEEKETPEQKVVLSQFAVLCRDRKKLQELIKINPEYATCCDPIRKYTPAHLAAICADFWALTYLKHHGANLASTNADGATVYDMLRARGFGKRDPLKYEGFFKNVFVALDDVSTQENLSEILSRKSFQLIDCCQFSEDALLGLWIEPSEETDNNEVCSIFRHKKFLFDQLRDKIETKEFIGPPVRAKRITEGPLKGQLEIVASRKISKGQVIGAYCGDVILEQEFSEFDRSEKMIVSIDKRATRLLIDSDPRSQLLELANHSLPNAATMTINRKGFPEQIYYAIEDIEEGNPIYWDYGSQYFINDKFHELCPDRVIDFINNLEGKVFLRRYSQADHKYLDYKFKIVDDIPCWEKVPVNDPRVNAIELKHTGCGLMYIFDFLDSILRDDHAKKILLKALLLLNQDNELKRFGIDDKKFRLLEAKLIGK